MRSLESSLSFFSFDSHLKGLTNIRDQNSLKKMANLLQSGLAKILKPQVPRKWKQPGRSFLLNHYNTLQILSILQTPFFEITAVHIDF